VINKKKSRAFAMFRPQTSSTPGPTSTSRSWR
jgi:hypothetical protein